MSFAKPSVVFNLAVLGLGIVGGLGLSEGFDLFDYSRAQETIVTLEGNCEGTSLKMVTTPSTAKITAVFLADGCYFK
jgi:hypothetical protein